MSRWSGALYSNNDLMLQADVSGEDFPEKGRVGLLGYRDLPSEVESFRIYSRE